MTGGATSGDGRSPRRFSAHQTRQVRELLRRLTALSKVPGDQARQIHAWVDEELPRFPREGLLEAIDEACGPSIVKRCASLELYRRLLDVPGTGDRIRALLRNPEPRVRDHAIHQAGAHKLDAAVDALIELASPGVPDPTRERALWSLAEIRSPAAIPFLQDLAARDEPALRWRMAWVMARHGVEAFRAPLTRLFETDQHTVLAAWGLAKLGDRRALEHLVRELMAWTGQPGAKGPGGDGPRAAQALCDLHGWPHESTAPGIEATRERVRAIYPEWCSGS
jgi:HEAT repeat protein